MTPEPRCRVSAGKTAINQSRQRDQCKVPVRDRKDMDETLRAIKGQGQVGSSRPNPHCGTVPHWRPAGAPSAQPMLRRTEHPTSARTPTPQECATRRPKAHARLSHPCAGWHEALCPRTPILSPAIGTTGIPHGDARSTHARIRRHSSAAAQRPASPASPLLALESGARLTRARVAPEAQGQCPGPEFSTSPRNAVLCQGYPSCEVLKSKPSSQVPASPRMADVEPGKRQTDERPHTRLTSLDAKANPTTRKDHLSCPCK